MDSIVLGGGCFWCVEGALKGLRGVSEVIPGYSGGHVENPTYEQVCAKRTGHAEVVRVSFDTDIISTAALLEVFFTCHDPTQLNRQGNDIDPTQNDGDAHKLGDIASFATCERWENCRNCGERCRSEGDTVNAVQSPGFHGVAGWV